ncbi:GH36-type glycosyl hydrolase domain-containing protein [Bacillus sp. AFS041924]|uniref:GH36-type glycosyl hydrolase domain-containing protein n=1 Tax=Bacillus sp. AFS041924 TaxID=2033503 RepID=UPI000BFE8802|nr:cellobiose phosphorylase [Bacillus sp. AFS041924]PGS48765.1 cellobiose phosphorylase [Bacillus sp. AFS041924]
MLNLKNKEKYHLNCGQTTASFLNSGDLYELTNGTTMINQLRANPIDGAISNLYLRLYTQEGIKAYPLLGIQSESTVKFSKTQVIWEGKVANIDYTVTFTLTDQSIWFWDLSFEGPQVEFDVIYGQDVGLANRGMIQSNEAYVSQYIDHTVFENEDKGYVVCSRQNQPQDGQFPYLQLGSLSKVSSFSTDGYQFFGLSYKETDLPEVLFKETLANEVYQYEFAYIALQSEKMLLNKKENIVFYGLSKENHESSITKLEYETEINKAWNQVENSIEFEEVEKLRKNPKLGTPLQTLSMKKEEIDQYFPDRFHEELDGETLLSFFTGTHEHVVLKEKERLVERSHGHIILSGENLKINEEIITSTSYMYGLFNAQVVVGNTSMNKMMSNARNSLNVMKTSGQRIYVEIDHKYHLLTMPSMYEMGFNYARWYYKTDDELFIISNFTTTDLPEIRLHIQATSGKKYRFIVTNQILMNGNEYEVPFEMKQEGQLLSFYTDESCFVANTYPNLCYHMDLKGAKMVVTDESSLINGAAPLSASLVVLDLEESNEFTITIQGHINGGEFIQADRKLEAEISKYRNFYQNVMNGFKLTLNNNIPSELGKLNTLTWWYTHNMLIHYLVPHGLEQYGGAAWGTRDVCQGPTEFFMATGKYEIVRNILLTVFSHQYEDDGNWPQWFMFDKYFSIQAGESHGDIIVWPLKALSDYLLTTKDFSILEEEISFTERDTFKLTERKSSLLKHVRKEINYIKDNFLHDTFLSSYGDGDWDDTLQPSNAQLKKYMVSSWTVALTYQTLKQFASVIKEIDEIEFEEITHLVNGIASDFKKYILNTDVTPGFIYLEDPNLAEMMIHPSDQKTGIQYRLLPMTRSMIAELFTLEEANYHYEIIKEHLQHPDGVRLMNKPATYTGGVSKNFKRAEQASNFGREIGLQYVHAHIRFIEAMAKLGKENEVWHALSVINPINLKDVVPNAEYRQSNTYFSSSDGKFNNRYEAQEQFTRLKNGKVAVKGGWRIYSSGPGIYLNQLISNSLGIRLFEKNLVIDPVLPKELNGLHFEFVIDDYKITFIYHLKGHVEKKVLVNSKLVDFERKGNRYREGGFVIQVDDIIHNLHDGINIIDIYM